MRQSQLRRRLVRTGRFLAAVAVGIFFALVRRDNPWKRFRGFITLLTLREKTPAHVVYARTRACYKCPIFYKPLHTCGSPLNRDMDGLGCWCNVDAKNGIASAPCWLREETGGEHGWSEKLYL